MSHTYKDHALFIDRLERKFKRKIHALNAKKAKIDDERAVRDWDVYLYLDDEEDNYSDEDQSPMGHSIFLDRGR